MSFFHYLAAAPARPKQSPLVAHDAWRGFVSSRCGFVARRAAFDLRRLRFAFGFVRVGLDGAWFDAAKAAQHGVGGALTRFPGAAHRAPQRLMRRLAGIPNIVGDAVHQLPPRYLAS